MHWFKKFDRSDFLEYSALDCSLVPLHIRVIFLWILEILVSHLDLCSGSVLFSFFYHFIPHYLLFFLFLTLKIHVFLIFFYLFVNLNVFTIQMKIFNSFAKMILVVIYYLIHNYPPRFLKWAYSMNHFAYFNPHLNYWFFLLTFKIFYF